MSLTDLAGHLEMVGDKHGARSPLNLAAKVCVPRRVNNVDQISSKKTYYKYAFFKTPVPKIDSVVMSPHSQIRWTEPTLSFRFLQWYCMNEACRSWKSEPRTSRYRDFLIVHF